MAGQEESVTLPDGRVVNFVVPADFVAGQIIEVEVGRTEWKSALREAGVR